MKSVRWKVEKRVLERIGNVVRMGDHRVMKGLFLGWWDKLEEVDRVPGRRRKTVLYWKRLLRKAGVNWTRERILEWERSQGHKWDGVFEGERNATKEERTSLVHVCEVCGTPFPILSNNSIRKNYVCSVSFPR